MARKHFSPSVLTLMKWACPRAATLNVMCMLARELHLIVLREETWQCLRKLHCSRLLRASCALPAAARKWLDICLQAVLRSARRSALVSVRKMLSLS